jgi:deoxyadenosine/deoxycytidine kinase
MNKKQLIIIVRGRIGSGKSTLVEYLCNQFEFKSLIIDKIKKDVKGRNRIERIFRKSGNYANEILKKGDSVVIEEAFYNKVHLDILFSEIEEIEKIKVLYIRLDCNIETAIKRKGHSNSKTITYQFEKKIDALKGESIIETNNKSELEVYECVKSLLSK